MQGVCVPRAGQSHQWGHRHLEDRCQEHRDVRPSHREVLCVCVCVSCACTQDVAMDAKRVYQCCPARLDMYIRIHVFTHITVCLLSGPTAWSCRTQIQYGKSVTDNEEVFLSVLPCKDVQNTNPAKDIIVKQLLLNNQHILFGF